MLFFQVTVVHVRVRVGMMGEEGEGGCDGRRVRVCVDP